MRKCDYAARHRRSISPAHLPENFPRMTKEKQRKSEKCCWHHRSGLSTREFSNNDPRKAKKIRECCWHRRSGLSTRELSQTDPGKNPRMLLGTTSLKLRPIHTREFSENDPTKTEQVGECCWHRRSGLSTREFSENDPRKTEKIRECC